MTEFEGKLERVLHKLFSVDGYWIKDCIKDVQAIIIESRRNTPKPEFKSVLEMVAYVRGQNDWAKKMNLKERKHVIPK